MFVRAKTFNKLVARVDALTTKLNGVDDRLLAVEQGPANDATMALAEVREVRDRISPLFGQGAEANAAMIERVRTGCGPT